MGKKCPSAILKLSLLLFSIVFAFGQAFSQKPVFTSCPGNINITVNTTNNACSAPINYTVLATGTPTFSYTFTVATSMAETAGTGSGSTFNKGITIVTVTATNSFGSSNCTFIVEVKDVTPPTITCPPLD